MNSPLGHVLIIVGVVLVVIAALGFGVLWLASKVGDSEAKRK